MKVWKAVEPFKMTCVDIPDSLSSLNGNGEPVIALFNECSYITEQ